MTVLRLLILPAAILTALCGACLPAQLCNSSDITCGPAGAILLQTLALQRVPAPITEEASEPLRIFVNDNSDALVYRFEDMSGTNQAELSRPGWNNVQGITVDGSGRIYVTSTFSGELYRYDDISGAGEVVYDGSNGTTFNRPFGVGLDASGRILVADLIHGLLYRFDDMSGTNQSEYDGSNGTPFQGIRGLWVDGNDRIVLADSNIPMIYRLDDATGSGQVEYDDGGNLAPAQYIYAD